MTTQTDRTRLAQLAADELAAGASQADVLRTLDGSRAQCVPPLSAVQLAGIISEQAGAQVRARRAGVLVPPLETPTLTGRRYAWIAAGVSLTIERIAAGRDALMAELVIDADPSVLPEHPPRLHGPVRLNLLSTANREGLARYMGRRLAMPWTDILESAFRLAIEAHRTGEPATRLADPVPPGASGYAIEPLILEDDPTMFFAKGGSGKSWLALAVAAALDGAAGVLPFRTLVPHRVAYLDWEWTRARHARRLSMMLDADQMAACGILYRRMAGSLVSQVDQLARMIEDHGVTYLVIDSLGMACGDDPEKASTALPFANAVRSLGVGSLWVTHTTKGGDQETAFGSTYWTNAARSAWQVQCLSEPGAQTMRLALHQRKVNDGPPEEPISLALRFADGRLTIARTDIYQEPDLQGAIPARARILGRLRQGAATAGDLVQSTGLAAAAVDAELARLVMGRRVVQLTSGAWGLLDARATVQNGHASGADIAAELPL